MVGVSQSPKPFWSWPHLGDSLLCQLRVQTPIKPGVLEILCLANFCFPPIFLVKTRQQTRRIIPGIAGIVSQDHPQSISHLYRPFGRRFFPRYRWGRSSKIRETVWGLFSGCLDVHQDDCFQGVQPCSIVPSNSFLSDLQTWVGTQNHVTGTLATFRFVNQIAI